MKNNKEAGYADFHKICRRCKQDKHPKEFGNNASQKDGLHWNCKPCAKLAAKESRERKKAKREQMNIQNQEGRLDQQHLTKSQRSLAKEILQGKPKELEQLDLPLDEVMKIKNLDGKMMDMQICAKGHSYTLIKGRKVCPSCNQPFIKEAVLPYKNPRMKVF